MLWSGVAQRNFDSVGQCARHHDAQTIHPWRMCRFRAERAGETETRRFHEASFQLPRAAQFPRQPDLANHGKVRVHALVAERRRNSDRNCQIDGWFIDAQTTYNVT